MEKTKISNFTLAMAQAEYMMEHPLNARKDFGLEQLARILEQGMTRIELQDLFIKHADERR